MMKTLLTILVILFGFGAGLCAGTAQAKNSKPEPKNNSVLLNRIDFGNSYIMGQSIKSGAVYLLQRKKSEIKSMLEYRTDYRDEILEDFSVHDLKITDKTSKKQKP